MGWTKEQLERIERKMPAVVKRNRGKVPYSGQNGLYDDLKESSMGWWTNGFYGGILWELYHDTGEACYREEAERLEREMVRVLLDYNSMDHDSGFRFLPTAVADYKVTGNPASRNMGLLAAENLAGRFNPKGRFLRAWNDDGDGCRAGWAIIDSMMNLPLLYWAAAETGDPKYYEIAVEHADTILEHFIREDGSSRHIVEFDAATGAFVREHGGQGIEVGSSWSRGQSWALHGFALSYRYTKDARYLETAERVSDYFLAHMPEGDLAPIDFCQPASESGRDTTATAIAASGLLTLAQEEIRAAEDAAPEQKAARLAKAENYRTAAEQLLQTICRLDCDLSADTDYLTNRGTAAYHDEKHEFPIIYGDYYLIEALLKAEDRALEIF